MGFYCFIIFITLMGMHGFDWFQITAGWLILPFLNLSRLLIPLHLSIPFILLTHLVAFNVFRLSINFTIFYLCYLCYPFIISHLLL